MTKTAKKYGIEWKCEHDKWEATAYDRYRMMTWKFGDIWQCGINIPFSSPLPNSGSPYANLGVRIGLEPTKSRDASMKKALQWVEDYRKNGPQTWEQICRNCYDKFPTLFKRESDVIKHVFFTIGNGYSWLDGSIICEHPEDTTRYRKTDLDEYYDRIDASFERIATLCEQWQQENKEIPEGLQKFVEEAKERRKEKILETETHRLPLPEPKEGIDLEYPSEEYSNIMCIPDDVTDDYLLLCSRIWTMFRFNNTNKEVTFEDKKRLYKRFNKRFEDRLARLL